jgi:acyl carrier protein
MDIETSFGISFSENELSDIKILGEFCDYISNKIELENAKDCTSQQAFYKLRHAISVICKSELTNIKPSSNLQDFLPRNTRREIVEELEDFLEIKLNILRPPHWVSNTLICFVIASLFSFFIDFRIGLFGLAFSISALWLANNLGNELNIKTVGDLAQKITREHYINSRRNPQTFNKTEIEKVLIDWISNNFHIDKSKLTRDAKFD